jgi:YD repeat-containing protein
MPTSGTVAGLGSGFSFGQFTFTDMPLSSVTTSNLANYDTAVLLQVPTGSLSDANKQAINGFVTNGKKLIIYDSDATSGNDYAWLAAPADTGVGCPNCGSRSGTATVLEDNSMVSSDPSDPNHYINTDEVATQTDAVGDANVMLSRSSAWFVDIQATNSVGETGAVHTYASVGKGLMIYNGLDSDYIGNSSYSSSGVDWLGKLWFRELMQPWDPDHLPHQTPVDQPADRTKEDRGDNLGDCPNGNQACGGDPVNLVTGNVYDIEEDLNLPGRGLPLEFKRTYNSQDDISATLGYGWTHSYNVLLLEKPDGSVTELNPQGARLTFTRNADGSYTKPKGVHETLTKNPDGTYILRKQDGVEWRFGTEGTLQKITDPNANALTFSYGAEGRLTKITDDVGRDTTLTYNASGRVDTLTDPAGRVVRYGYSEVGDLTSVTDPAGNTTRYEYSAAHNLLKVTHPGDPFGSGNAGGTYTYTYDGQDRATSITADNGNYKMTMDYRFAENRTLVTDSKGNTSEYHYDQDEQVTKIVDPYGKAITYTWDARGNQTSESDQLGNVTQMQYDARDNLTKVIEPKPTATATVNPTTTFTYEPTFNRLTSVTDPEGGLTNYTYDTKGNLTSMVDASGNKTTFEYDQFGQLVKSVNPKGNATSQDTTDGITTFTYSNDGNLIGITDPAAKKTTANYGVATTTTSVLGVPTSVTDALGRTTDFAYDNLGQITKVTNPLTPPDTARTTVSMTYDAVGNLASVTDEKGHTTTYDHNPLGWLTKEKRPDPDPADSVPAPATTYNYDTEGNLTSETDSAGNTTTYAYDKLTRLTSVTRPDGTADGVVTSYTYDDAGRIVSEKDANGNVRNYSYDNLDRLTKVSDLKADGTTLAAASYDYDLLGRMAKATNPNGNATSYSYDKISNLTKETDPLGNSFSYAYDENGNLKSRTDAMGASPTTRTTPWTGSRPNLIPMEARSREPTMRWATSSRPRMKQAPTLTPTTSAIVSPRRPSPGARFSSTATTQPPTALPSPTQMGRRHSSSTTPQTGSRPSPTARGRRAPTPTTLATYPRRFPTRTGPATPTPTMRLAE